MESSASSSSSRRRKFFEWQEGRSVCRCGDREVLWTSWTSKNPGRRFYGCRNYSPLKEQFQNKGCNHFRWYDCEMSERAKEVINELKTENRILQKENSELMKKSESLRKIDAETEFDILAEALSDLKKWRSVEVESMRKRLNKVYLVLALAWLLVIVGVCKML